MLAVTIAYEKKLFSKRMQVITVLMNNQVFFLFFFLFLDFCPATFYLGVEMSANPNPNQLFLFKLVDCPMSNLILF